MKFCNNEGLHEVNTPSSINRHLFPVKMSTSMYMDPVDIGEGVLLETVDTLEPVTPDTDI